MCFYIWQWSTNYCVRYPHLFIVAHLCTLVLTIVFRRRSHTCVQKYSHMWTIIITLRSNLTVYMVCLPNIVYGTPTFVDVWIYSVFCKRSQYTNTQSSKTVQWTLWLVLERRVWADIWLISLLCTNTFHMLLSTDVLIK
jgi:hypothetical protein